MENAKAVVNEQAEDEGLWFVPKYITEDYLQKSLRRLHAAVEDNAAALEWYGEKAKSLATKDWKKNPAYAEAILTELMLDGGHRAGLTS